MKSYSIKEINALLNGELIGTTNQKIIGPEHLEKASTNQITFIGNKKYVHLWKTSSDWDHLWICPSGCREARHGPRSPPC